MLCFGLVVQAGLLCLKLVRKGGEEAAFFTKVNRVVCKRTWISCSEVHRILSL